MNITMTPELLEYLKENNLDSFTLSVKRTKSCCSAYNLVVPTFGPPTEKMGPCKAYPTEYGITVHISDLVQLTKDTLIFGINHLFQFYRITMNGVQEASR